MRRLVLQTSRLHDNLQIIDAFQKGHSKIKIQAAACGCIISQSQPNSTKKEQPSMDGCSFGDPYGNRTHVTAVKGRCLNRLTNGPYGSGNLTRTDDTPGMNRMLYQLSYAAMCFNSKIDYTR